MTEFLEMANQQSVLWIELEAGIDGHLRSIIRGDGTLTMVNERTTHAPPWSEQLLSSPPSALVSV